MSLIKDGPAAKSGEVSVGDLLHSIDGHSIDTLDDGAHTQETAIIHLSTMHKPTHKHNSNAPKNLCYACCRLNSHILLIPRAHKNTLYRAPPDARTRNILPHPASTYHLNITYRPNSPDANRRTGQHRKDGVHELERTATLCHPDSPSRENATEASVWPS